ncbi:MAG: hypothetical protein BroJett021_33690 [Chloroflexota bacterium]|jgi:hypothetical protein|nr:MAG: hypothetical protein BroJett021_33690 [Chloroflexota bacterium]
METVDLLTAITNFGNELPGIYELLKFLTYAVALWYIAHGVLGMIENSKNPGNGRSGSGFGILLVGALLLNFDNTMSVIFSSMSGHDGVSSMPGAGAASAIGYVPSGGVNFSAAIVAVMKFITVVGVFSAFKGFMLWKRASEGHHSAGGGEDHVWQGMTHIFFGALCINITETAQMFRSTITGL